MKIIEYQNYIDFKQLIEPELTDRFAQLSSEKGKLLEAFISSEKYGFVGLEELLRQLKCQEPLTLLAFACLPVIDYQQIVSTDINRANFFSQLNAGRLNGFLRRMQFIDPAQWRLLVLMADAEPWTVFGWDQLNKNENQKLIDELISKGRHKLFEEVGPNATMLRYSDFFTAQEVIMERLEKQIALPRNFLNEEYSLVARPGLPIPDPFTAARRSILAYAAEGVELFEQPPLTILGIETPIRQRSSVVNLARWQQPVPVIHPVMYTRRKQRYE